MSNRESPDDADKMLSTIDFGKMMDVAGMIAAQNEKHRQETAKLLFEFLEVVDSLEALGVHCKELVANGQQHVPLRSVDTMLRQALKVLAGAGVEQMNAVGQPLNLELHQVDAVTVEAAVQEDTVLEEKVRGYLWNGLLLRRARVVISR